MPFGSQNAVQTLQRFKEVLRGLHFCYAYMDDLLIGSSDPKHKRHLQLVLECLNEHGVIINPAKFLRHQVDSQGIRFLGTFHSLPHDANIANLWELSISITVSFQTSCTPHNSPLMMVPSLCPGLMKPLQPL